MMMRCMALLTNDNYLQTLIGGLIYMDKSDRNYFIDDPGDRKKGIGVMESTPRAP
jgi:hypothetical protein